MIYQQHISSQKIVKCKAILPDLPLL